MSGAAYFSGRAAYSAGAGLVRILTPEANRIILQSQLPQAMISVWEEMDETQWADTLSWADVMVIGPGVGTEAVMAERIQKALAESRCPVIMDADGLNLLAQHEEWYPMLAERAVLTPHMGEMSRLTGNSIGELKADRAKAALDFAEKHRVICVLKDSSTVVSDGKGLYFNQTGNHGMATGGSGDVLAGIIGALAGAGAPLFDAAYMGVFLHGSAGDAAAARFGMRGMTSVEIIEGLWEILKRPD